MPNCPFYYVGAKLSWCQIVRCQIVRFYYVGAKLSGCQIVRCQIVRCQIVLPPMVSFNIQDASLRELVSLRKTCYYQRRPTCLVVRWPLTSVFIAIAPLILLLPLHHNARNTPTVANAHEQLSTHISIHLPRQLSSCRSCLIVCLLRQTHIL